MRIGDWMKHHVRTVKPRDTVAHARELLETHRINQLPVVHDGTLVGLISDRDVRDAYPSVIEAVTHPLETEETPEHIPVEDVMARQVLTLGPDDALLDGARLMRRERIGAVPIVDGGRLVGLLTRSDVLDAFVALAGRERSGASRVADVPSRAPRRARG